MVTSVLSFSLCHKAKKERQAWSFVFNFLSSLVPSPGRCVLLTEPRMEIFPFHVILCVSYRALPSSLP